MAYEYITFIICAFYLPFTGGGGRSRGGGGAFTGVTGGRLRGGGRLRECHTFSRLEHVFHTADFIIHVRGDATLTMGLDGSAGTCIINYASPEINVVVMA